MGKVPLWYFDYSKCCEEEDSIAYSLQQNRQGDCSYQGIYTKAVREGNVRLHIFHNFDGLSMFDCIYLSAGFF